MINKKIIKGLVVVGVVLINLCFGLDCFAGGWIGSGDTTSPPGGSGSGTSCNSSTNKFQIDCAGVSWVFYRSDYDHGRDINFPSAVYNNFAENNAWISGECAKNTSQGGGFWHFGINSFRSDLTNYSYGHWQTIIWGRLGYHDATEKFLPSTSGYDYYGLGLIFNYISYPTQSVNGYTAFMTASADEVLKYYKQAYKGAYPNATPEELNNITSLPYDLYAFCWWPQDDEPKYYGISNVSAGGKSATTDIVPIDSEAVSEVDIELSLGEKGYVYLQNLEFSHNIYSKKAGTYLYWDVNRNPSGANSLTSNGDGYEIAVRRFAKITRPNDLKAYIYYNQENGFYIPYERQSGDSILKDSAPTVKFTKAGNYRFCEVLTMNINYYNLNSSPFTSEACVNVTVHDGTDEPPCEGENCGGLCEEYKQNHSSSFERAHSYVVSLVKNDSLTTRKQNAEYSGWKGALNQAELDDKVNVTYAMPTDKVEWINCYFPGAQVYADEEVVYINGTERGTHAAEGVEYDTTNGTVRLGIDWTNDYEVTTSKNGSVLKIGSSIYNPNSSASKPAVGVFKGQDPVTNEFSVSAKDDVGKEYNDTIKLVGNNPTESSIYNDGLHPWEILKDEGYESCWDDYCIDDKGESYACGGGCDWISIWVKYYYSHTNDVVYGSYTSNLNNPLSSKAYVKIPYNYKNTARLHISGGSEISDVVYAGESVNLDTFAVSTEKKSNSNTEATYATKVEDAKIRLIAYVANSPSGIQINGKDAVVDHNCSSVSGYDGYCSVVDEYDGMLNEEGKIDGYPNHNKDNNGGTFTGSYNVFDVDAGKYFCMATAVYPATSGNDDNTTDKNGDHSWYVSEPSCLVVAKKPSFQVWGGNLYSDGNITTAISKKNVIDGVYDYSQGSSGVVFGSWVEQGVFSNGLVRGLASGAAGGRTKNSIGSGSIEGAAPSLCKNRATLSFANYYNGNFGIGICDNNDATGMMNSFSTAANHSALVDYFAGLKNYTNNNEYSSDMFGKYVLKSTATGKTIKYYTNDGDFTLYSDAVITNGSVYRKTNDTVIINTNGNYNINGNITNNSPTTSAEYVSQVVIYAKGNINIACSVNRVDAILIAEGKVSTCSGHSADSTDQNDLNSGDRNNQLKINGSVVANKLDLGRTWGNTIGKGSGTPAEIINYSTASLLWAASMASVSESDTLTTVYQHELATRY